MLAAPCWRLAFATYAGGGAHTTYGFGVTLPEPTWQPPTQTPPATTIM